MTFLEVVNNVLVLMRQDEITTTVGVEDEAVKVVIQHVNDAKRKVENSWRWNALRDEWSITGVASQKTYALTGTEEQVIIDDVVSESGKYYLKQTSPKFMKRKDISSVGNGPPLEYAINGINSSREVQIDFWPTPEGGESLTVVGWGLQPALASDATELKVPYLPVVYEALAMAARERGEVGGQTALEIFGMAKKYLADSIALDAAMSPLDTNWYTI